MTDLDPLIHAPKRLRIMTILHTADSVEFAFLQDRLGLSASDLSKQMSALAEAGYAKAKKTGRGPGSTTWYNLTRSGRAAYKSHVAAFAGAVGRRGGARRRGHRRGGRVKDAILVVVIGLTGVGGCAPNAPVGPAPADTAPSPGLDAGVAEATFDTVWQVVISVLKTAGRKPIGVRIPGPSAFQQRRGLLAIRQELAPCASAGSWSPCWSPSMAAPFAHAERLAVRVQGAEFVRLEGGSHAALFTHSAEVRPHVARFLGATAAAHNSTRRVK